jgi:hypothetical protein
MSSPQAGGMTDLDGLGRIFFDALYTYRIPIAIASVVALVLVVLIAARRGWFAAARRHPGRSAVLLVAALAVALPVGWYMASPLFIRTELIEPDPIAAAVPAPSPPVASTPTLAPSAPAADPATDASTAPPSRPAATTPTPAPSRFAPVARRSGTFAGTDDFHFGRGIATIVETSPGTYLLRLDDFSVRNGPDLYVYLSPDPSDYVDGAVELGKLKATDGAFGYALPDGTDPADFASVLIWCRQFSHLFAVAPFEPA